MLDWIRSFFSKALRAFNDLFRMAFPIARQIIIGQLQSFAIDTVARLAQTDLNNEEKRKRAFEDIKDKAVSSGIEVRDSLINVLIEMAVLSFKKEF